MSFHSIKNFSIRVLCTHKCRSEGAGRIRSIHLIHQIVSKYGHLPSDLLVKKLDNFDPIPCHVVSGPGVSGKSKLALPELLSLIQPYHVLELSLPKDAKEVTVADAAASRYKILNMGILKNDTAHRGHKRVGRSKQIHITTSLHPLALRHKLRLACTYLELNQRLEFHLRPKVGRKSMTVDWALCNLPYLRPDVISRSMPQGTELIVPPMEHQGQLIWAFSKIEEDVRKMATPQGRALQRSGKSLMMEKALLKSQKPPRETDMKESRRLQELFAAENEDEWTNIDEETLTEESSKLTTSSNDFQDANVKIRHVNS